MLVKEELKETDTSQKKETEKKRKKFHKKQCEN